MDALLYAFLRYPTSCQDAERTDAPTQRDAALLAVCALDVFSVRGYAFVECFVLQGHRRTL
jgi:hypothetical protein